MYRPTPPFLAFLAVAALIGALALSGCGDRAHAQVTNDVLTWVAPTQRVDGTALSPAEILQYKILSAPVAGGPAYTQVAVVNGDLLTFTRSTRPSGRQCYVLQTVDTAGLISPNSNESCTEKCALGQRVNPAGACVAIANPKSPTNVQAT